MTEQQELEHWERVNPDFIRFARLEFNRRLAIRCIRELAPELNGIHTTLYSRIVRVLEVFAEELSQQTHSQAGEAQYDGDRFRRITQAHIEAIETSRDFLVLKPALGTFDPEKFPKQPGDVDRLILHLLHAAKKVFRETGAHYAAMILGTTTN
ncbi:MAG TPA: hypothetical protein VGR47_03950 [Terracidiphilus sp.]|nr:hypothetical protein [Terracidiphilus sp.]